MDEALILEKLENVSAEMRQMKADVLQEVRQELAPFRQQRAQPALAELFQDIDNPFAKEELERLLKTLSISLAELDEAVEIIRSGIQLRQDLGPITRQVYPRTTEFFAELDGEFHFDELTILLRKAITNLDTMGEGIDLLRAGVELRDELVPVFQLMYPRLLRFLSALHEGEFQAEKLGDLLHTVLINIHTLSDLLNMLQPMTELVKEVGVLAKETDVMRRLTLWLDGLQQSNGVVRLAGTIFMVLKGMKFNDKQIDEICKTIENIDFNNVQPVGAFGMIKQLNDPKVQDALGFMFMLLQAMGTCVQVYQKNGAQQAAA
jgi:uncharacterized protein YjgD (DUF1641 family)